MTHVRNGDGVGQTPSATFQGDHTEAAPSAAAEGGTSRPVPEPGYSDTPPGCNCGSYRFKLPEEDTDPRTGEVTRPTASRRSTAVWCPVHGVNDRFRRSYSGNAAHVCRRSDYRRCDLWHATVRLHPADVERLNLSADDTRPVLTQLLPRLRKRLKRRDPDAEVLLSMSPRPSDGQWHLHVLVLSKGCSDDDLVEVFRLAGTDTEITTPRSREADEEGPPMSAETFAAAMGAYLFDNRVQGAVQGAQTKFSSWGEGVGYFSKAARERRREYAEMMAEAGGDTAPARCSSSQFPTQHHQEAPGEEASDGDNDAVEPVSVGVSAVQSEAEYRRVVIRALLERVHTDVTVQGLGRCRLTWVEMGDDHLITCYVRPLESWDDDQRVVPWRMVDAVETPVIRRSTASDRSPDMNASDDTDDSTADDADPDRGTPEAADVQYWEEARHGRVSFVLPDGRRHVEDTDHRTGETTTTTKPPRR